VHAIFDSITKVSDLNLTFGLLKVWTALNIDSLDLIRSSSLKDQSFLRLGIATRLGLTNVIYNR
jgi:hypothetical protein